MNKYFIVMHDLIEANGKSVKENNLEIKHNIPIGSLVEYSDGTRLFVVYHSRDCDGTCLYNLCPNKDDLIREEKNFYNRKWFNGYPEDALRVITVPTISLEHKEQGNG